MVRSRGRLKATFEPVPPDAVHRKTLGRWAETADWGRRRPDAAVAVAAAAASFAMIPNRAAA